jgi:hypothetical protein
MLNLMTLAIVFELFFAFEAQGCAECRKCRSNFLLCPDFSQIPCSTDLFRFNLQTAFLPVDEFYQNSWKAVEK